eukprot:PhF_6_TR12542/c0_g1_i1/m.19668
MTTEPEDTKEYATQQYWDRRYTTEESYEWFQTAHHPFLVWLEREILPSATNLLHLGCGNSNLCFDIQKWCKQNNRTIRQTAIDFSPIVIENMKSKDLEQSIQWVVADVRNLSMFAAGTFDVVLDKGTMDAIQADKDSDTLDEDIHAMLMETSKVLAPRGTFVQVTWEIPYYRLHWTKRGEYGWDNEQLTHGTLGDSDMYRVYRYIKN